MAECKGSGSRWGSGTGCPICPICHRGPIALGVKSPIRRKGKWTGNVPLHEERWKRSVENEEQET